MTYKPPRHRRKRNREASAQVRGMAVQITDQAMLDRLMESASEHMRRALVEQLAPYLTFTPRELCAADCPTCGLRRGNVIEHLCSAQRSA